MDGRRLGLVVRTVRLHAGWRQEDVAARARVSQRWVSELELGRTGHLSLAAIERICQALDVDLRFQVRWLGGNLDRLIDRDHAAVVERVVWFLRRAGWSVRLEYGFNHYGERGSVDILAWHPGERVLLIVEVKSRLTDLQDTIATLERKVRIVPRYASRDGWDPRLSASMLVVLGTVANRRVVAEHPETFAMSYPDRARRIRAWLRAPAGALRGLWMMDPRTVGRRSRGAARQRVRPRPDPLPVP